MHVCNVDNQLYNVAYGSLILATTRRQRGYCNRLAIFVRSSVHRNPPMINGKGRLRESTHSRYARHKGIVIMFSPAQRPVV